MGYLNSQLQRKYDLVIMSSDGGWTRSFVVRGKSLIFGAAGGLGAIVILLAVLAVSLYRLSEYDALLRENQQLRLYRNSVRRTVLNADQFGLLAPDIVQALLQSFRFEYEGGVNPASLDSREGGMVIDHQYINFLDNVPTLPPVNGFVTRGLMLREIDLQSNHSGLDIAAVTGDIIQAAASGLVVFSQWTEDLGYMVILSHGDEYFTVYGHNKINLVSARERVARGEAIAQVGNTGISQGPHLHFEIWKEGKSIDPRTLMDLYRRQDISIKRNG